VRTQLYRGGQGHGYQAGILAGEEETDEFRVGLGDQRYALALLCSQADQLGCQLKALFAQIPVGDARIDRPATGVEVDASLTERCVVQGLGQGGEIAAPVREVVLRRCTSKFLHRVPSLIKNKFTAQLARPFSEDYRPWCRARCTN
jgi:hypothetical protein